MPFPKIKTVVNLHQSSWYLTCMCLTSWPSYIPNCSSKSCLLLELKACVYPTFRELESKTAVSVHGSELFPQIKTVVNLHQSPWYLPCMCLTYWPSYIPNCSSKSWLLLELKACVYPTFRELESKTAVSGHGSELFPQIKTVVNLHQSPWYLACMCLTYWPSYVPNCNSKSW